MGIRPLEGLFVVLILLGIGGHVALTDDRTQRNFEFLPNMVHGPAYEAQDACPVFPDGRTLQAPPAGTIARGHPALRSGDRLLTDGTTLWKELPAAEQASWDALVSPGNGQELDAAALEKIRARGSFVFENTCTVCHGAGGAGDGAVTKRGVPPPPSLLLEAARTMSDGQMFRVITYGRGNMAAHAAQVGREDRWKVIHYIRSLQRVP